MKLHPYVQVAALQFSQAPVFLLAINDRPNGYVYDVLDDDGWGGPIALDLESDPYYQIRRSSALEMLFHRVPKWP